MTSRDPRVLLLYPPNQSWPDTPCKPNGSLAYPCLGGALRERSIHVDVYDACVGGAGDELDQFFHQSTELESGLVRTGVEDERILSVVADYDVIGITSIFTDQETMVLHTARLIKAAYGESKVLVTGGTNARARLHRFLAADFDLVFLSEAERGLVELIRILSNGSRDFSDLRGVAHLRGGKSVVEPASAADIVTDLDTLPMPAWDLLPNERYWAVGRPHGGYFPAGKVLRYASMLTSLGCPFRCSYCHIGGEIDGSLSGAIARYRIKSDERVLAELTELERLGVRQVFIEDDSLFGNKRRSLRLLRLIRDFGLEIFDVNGLNIVHLLRKGEPDEEVIAALAEAGFTQVSLPFESANPRIIRTYASNKWDVERSNVQGLIEMTGRYGITTHGNYMIGYPDETRAEIDRTLAMARLHREQGLAAAHVFLVMPLPGTPLFDIAIRGGYLDQDYDPDRMNQARANMKNTAVPAEELEDLRYTAWRDLNERAFVERTVGWRMKSPAREHVPAER
jgi:anaerobic magnesium-protoporphyrin IX monomethyl ester cyclase